MEFRRRPSTREFYDPSRLIGSRVGLHRRVLSSMYRVSGFVRRHVCRVACPRNARDSSTRGSKMGTRARIFRSVPFFESAFFALHSAISCSNINYCKQFSKNSDAFLSEFSNPGVSERNFGQSILIPKSFFQKFRRVCPIIEVCLKIQIMRKSCRHFVYLKFQ